LCLLVLSQVPVWMEQVLYGVSGVFILYLARGVRHRCPVCWRCKRVGRWAKRW
jgi:hypothetical protein